MAAAANDRVATDEEGIMHRVSRRDGNRRVCTENRSATDAERILELSCECMRVDCERSVKVPLYVYRRMLDADQYLLQAGHHAFPQYRTIISVGLMRIEERL
jgi:hypothetical protein